MTEHLHSQERPGKRERIADRGIPPPLFHDSKAVNKKEPGFGRTDKGLHSPERETSTQAVTSSGAMPIN